MSVYETTDFRKGLKVEIERQLYVIVESQHVNPGKGSAFVRTRLKNLSSGQVLERTFKAGVDSVDVPDTEEKEMEYMYADIDGHNFMDQKNFETIHLTHENVDDAKNYLKEGIKVGVLYFNGRPISIDLPNFVTLRVTETDPGLRGDTATGGSKKATMETGLQVNVPLFIKSGELLRIDTRTGTYMERVKE